jgi:hypothetical protein
LGQLFDLLTTSTLISFCAIIPLRSFTYAVAVEEGPEEFESTKGCSIDADDGQ